jgi:O-antigen ligase
MARLNVRQLAPAGAELRSTSPFGLRTGRLTTAAPQVGVLGIALALGVVAAVQPKLAIAAALGLVFLAVVISNLAVGLVALVALAFFEEYSELSGGVSLTKVVGLILALALLAAIAAGRPEERQARDLVAQHRWLVMIATLFVAWATISLVWAEQWHAGTETLGRYLLNIALFPIAFAALRTRRHVVWVFSVFVASALLSVGFGLLHPADPSKPWVGRLGGAGLNPNQLGQLLAVAVVLAVGLAAANRRWPPTLAKIAALAAAAGCAAGLFLTVSREALLGLGVSLLVAPFVVGRGRRAGAVLLSALVLVAAVGWFSAVASQNDFERITHPESAGGSGREDLWRMGWRMTKDHPVTGVGVGNFRVESADYLIQPGAVVRDEYILDTPLVAHNIYLQVLSELGVVGLTLFVLILCLSLRSMLVAAREFARQGSLASEILARSLLIAVVGLLAADFFSSQFLSKQLWLLLAIGPALQGIAYRQAHGSTAE